MSGLGVAAWSSPVLSIFGGVAEEERVRDCDASKPGAGLNHQDVFRSIVGRQISRERASTVIQKWSLTGST